MMITSRRISLVALLVGAIWLAAAIPVEAARRPNVLVILADDQGWGDLSLHGNTNLATPNLDSIAHQGAMFERFFVCPVCSPTRAEFLTGRYHPRGGVYSTSTGGERLDLDEATIAEVFRAAGYQTAAFGKWHNGMQWPYHPTARGFDEFYGFCSGHWGHYFSPVLEHNGELVRGNGYVTDDFTNHAMQFMEANREKPFFCYVAYNTPHSPMQVPNEFYEKFADAPLSLRHREPEKENLPHTRAALAMCENIDWNVGRMLKKLDELGVAEDTIVVYFSDNGPNGWRFNGRMRGRKGSTDEGGVRVPLLVRWPKRIKPGQRIEQIGAAIDLLPTLAEMAEVPLVLDRPLDGISLAAVFDGRSPDAANGRLIFSHWAGRVSARTQRFRLDAQGRLYDMTNDPQQSQDVSDKHPKVTAELSQAISSWREAMLPGLRDDDRPFTVGYREFPTIHLPARDGVPHGNVERSARAPNCSFFRNWTSTDDRITWDIAVATPGRYRATLYYTCEEKNVGAKVQLSFGSNAVSTVIREAHDPPLVGRAEDRSDRGSESYVKDFRPMELGTFELPAGRDILMLSALEVPGDAVADVRYVTLTLLP